MKKSFLIIILLLNYLFSFSQDGFQFTTAQKKIKVPFELCNNLIIIPIDVNGVKLKFLLDTGVEKTILFSIDETDSLPFNNVEKIKIKGLGSGNAIEALHAKNNKISINGYVDENHEIFIILDQEVNFSSQLGITVHGIIGSEFFKNNLIEINYIKKRIIVHNKAFFNLKKVKNFEKLPLTIELEKPYIETYATLNSKEEKTKLLVDIGGSDALWLFENSERIQSPKNFFHDFIGRGFSGNIYGKRSRIDEFTLGKYKLELPTVSFPDLVSLENVTLVDGRNGSIGGEILKRFDLIFDYSNKKMYIQKNSNFDNLFNYNMSGLEIQHDGLQWIQNEVELKTKFVAKESSINEWISKANLKYNFSLKPIYKIFNVLENSPAAKAGILNDDIILKINGNYAYKYKLLEINELLKSEEDRWIRLEVKRSGYIFKTKFQLKKIL